MQNIIIYLLIKTEVYIIHHTDSKNNSLQSVKVRKDLTKTVNVAEIFPE